MKNKYAFFCHLHGKKIFEMITPFECSAVKDRRLWLMYSICSAPSDSNPDWCQLSGIILFAPHPFCATISPSIPSYSTVTPNVTLIHPPPHPSNYFSGISDTMSAEITKRVAIMNASENKRISFVLWTSFPFSFSCLLSPLHAGFRLQHLWGSGVSRGSRTGVESRSSSLWRGKSAGSAGHRTIYSPQTIPRLRLSAC